MFADLLTRMRSEPVKAELPEPDARLALGVLMLRIAKADQTYRVEEIGTIDKVLARRFDLNPVEAAQMRADCERLEKENTDDETFAELIRDHIPYDERLSCYRAMWKVMIADGVERPEEHEVLKFAEGAFDLLPLDTRTVRQNTDAD